MLRRKIVGCVLQGLIGQVSLHTHLPVTCSLYTVAGAYSTVHCECGGYVISLVAAVLLLGVAIGC